MLGKRCNRHGCVKAARFFVRLNVPANGYWGATTPSYRVNTNIETCTEHLAALHAKDFHSPELRAALEGVAKQMGIVGPDFSKVWIEGVPLDYGIKKEEQHAEEKKGEADSANRSQDDVSGTDRAEGVLGSPFDPAPKG